MVKGKFQEYFPTKNSSRTYSCLYCRAHLARHEDLISKSFQGSQGRAYLFNQIVNAEYSEAKQRVLLTGVHFVADVYCACCQTMLGWKYERAFEASQRYKEGKVIVELAHLIKDNCWDTEWFNPHYPDPLRTSCRTHSSILTRTRSSMAHLDPKDSGVFSSPELSTSLDLPTNLGADREPSSLPFDFSVNSNSSYPSTHFQLPFSLSPVSIRNLFHHVEPINTPTFYQPSLVAAHAVNSISSPNQLISSSDAGSLDENPGYPSASLSTVIRKEQSHSAHHCGETAAAIAACDIKSLTLPQTITRRLSLQPTVYKRHKRNRSFASHLMSSSSPSRISLLPLTSEDEDEDEAVEAPLTNSSSSNPPTLIRSGRDHPTFLQSSFDYSVS